MVRVNKKPQYLVFSLHFPHQPSKYGQLPVESSRNPCTTRTRASKLCPKFDAIPAFPVSQIRPSNSTIKPSSTPTRPQDAKTVQILPVPVRIVEIRGRFRAPRLTRAPNEARQAPERRNSGPPTASKMQMRPRADSHGPASHFNQLTGREITSLPARPSPRQRGDPDRQSYRNKGAITNLTVQSSLMSGYHHTVHRKRRPFPGDVFFDSQDRNQLLSLVSILIP